MSDGYNAYVFIGNELKSARFKDTDVYKRQLQLYMASEEAPYTVSQNDGLFLHPALTAPTYRTFQRSYHCLLYTSKNRNKHPSL